MSEFLYELAEKIADETVRSVVYSGQNMIGLYIGDDWRAAFGCGGLDKERYNKLIADVREVVREAIFKALCVQDSGSTSLSEIGINVGETKTNGE